MVEIQSFLDFSSLCCLAFLSVHHATGERREGGECKKDDGMKELGKKDVTLSLVENERQKGNWRCVLERRVTFCSNNRQ